jgi:hypothetical protein
MIGFRTEREVDTSFDRAVRGCDPGIVVHQHLYTSKEMTDA